MIIIIIIILYYLFVIPFRCCYMIASYYVSRVSTSSCVIGCWRRELNCGNRKWTLLLAARAPKTLLQDSRLIWITFRKSQKRIRVSSCPPLISSLYSGHLCTSNISSHRYFEPSKFYPVYHNYLMNHRRASSPGLTSQHRQIFIPTQVLQEQNLISVLFSERDANRLVLYRCWQGQRSKVIGINVSLLYWRLQVVIYISSISTLEYMPSFDGR